MIIKHGRHIFGEIDEVRKGMWAFLSYFSDADWLNRQTQITYTAIQIAIPTTHKRVYIPPSPYTHKKNKKNNIHKQRPNPGVLTLYMLHECRKGEGVVVLEPFCHLLFKHPMFLEEGKGGWGFDVFKHFFLLLTCFQKLNDEPFEFLAV